MMFGNILYNYVMWWTSYDERHMNGN